MLGGVMNTATAHRYIQSCGGLKKACLRFFNNGNTYKSSCGSGLSDTLSEEGKHKVYGQQGFNPDYDEFNDGSEDRSMLGNSDELKSSSSAQGENVGYSESSKLNYILDQRRTLDEIKAKVLVNGKAKRPSRLLY